MAEQAGNTGKPQRGVNRRTVVKGAAWSVPAVVVASAAPAMASASVPVVIDFGNSTACKIPGNSWGSIGYNKGYVLWAKFINNSGAAVSIQVTGIVVGGITQCLVGQVDTTTSECPSGLDACISIPNGGTKVIGVFSNASTDSSSTLVQVAFNWFESSDCTGVMHTSPVQEGNVTGSPWTTGGGSCKFPTGYTCNTPPSAGACA